MFVSSTGRPQQFEPRDRVGSLLVLRRDVPTLDAEDADRDGGTHSGGETRDPGEQGQDRQSR